MAQQGIKSRRPLSPHLTIHKPIPTMVMSILHRITGSGLYFGTLLLAWWLMAAASGQQYFDWVNGIFGSWPGRIVLLAFSWALIHHMLGGLRYLIWDTGVWMEKHISTRLAYANIIGSLILTLLVWIAAYAFR
jgi:succinate dehydrogenase / fumarate reductase cytochrome b subunit